MTFDLKVAVVVGFRHGWQRVHEGFSVCRHCGKSTIFVLHDRSRDIAEEFERTGLQKIDSVNDFMTVERYVSLRDGPGIEAPEHVPADILAVFNEGATCLSAACHNAAGTMFRLCVDLATKGFLPEGEVAGLNHKTRRDLGLRLPWLFDNGHLPAALRDLSHCIKEDGNDGAHAGTLTKEDAGDLLDFTEVLLKRLYTEPKQIELAHERRAARRTPAA